MPRPFVTTASKWLQLDDDTAGIYNSWDGVATARAYKGLKQELIDNGQWEWYRREFWPLVPVVLAMQKRGTGVLNTSQRNAQRVKYRRELRETDEVILKADPTGELSKPVGKSPHGINADKRVAKFLYDTLELRHHRVTDKGHRSVDQESLLYVLTHLRKKDEHARAVLENLCHRSRLETILTHYLTVEKEDDGRVHPRIKLYGAKTQRFAYADPALQQWPKEIRGCIEAAGDHLYISADYCQLEARILATLAEDRPSLDAFRAGEDIHSSNARDLLGYREDQWRSMDLDAMQGARNFSKSFLYGISYGGHAETMKTKTYCPCPRCVDHFPPTLDLSRADIKAASDRWFARHPAVREFRTKLVDEVMKKRRVHYYDYPLGYRRFFFTPWPTVEKELYNAPMQGTAAHIINRAMIRAKHLPLTLQMHDSLMMEVPMMPARMVDQYGADLQGIMEERVPELDTSFPVDLTLGPTWGDLKEWSV